MTREGLSLILSILMLTITVSAQTDAIGDFLKKRQNPAAAAQDLERQAEAFFLAVINQNAEEIYKFIHPNYVRSLEGRKGALELIEFEFEQSKRVDLKIVAVKINPPSIVTKSNVSPQKLPVRVDFRTEGKTVTFAGEITAVSAGSNWYFVHRKTILESFGVKEFEETGPQSDASPLSGGILNGQAVSLPAPEYPKAARAVGATGAVNVEVIIDESGNVIAAEAVSGHALLRRASEEAAGNARFKPRMINGQAVKVKGIIVYNYSK
jgi:TonB family protein